MMLPAADPAKRRIPARPEPQITAGALAISINVPAPSGLEAWLVSRALFVAGIITALTLIVLALYRVLLHNMGSATWSFDSSIATNLTFGGTILTVLASYSVLPATTQLMNKSSYSALSLIAAVLIMLAPALYTVGRKRVVVDGEEQLVGRVWVLAISSGLLLWAVILQISTFWAELIEIAESRVITTQTLDVLAFVLFIVCGAMCIYVPVSVVTNARYDSVPSRSPKKEKTDAKPPAGTPPVVPAIDKSPRQWSLP
jgi:hypothetical protein